MANKEPGSKLRVIRREQPEVLSKGPLMLRTLVALHRIRKNFAQKAPCHVDLLVAPELVYDVERFIPDIIYVDGANKSRFSRGDFYESLMLARFNNSNLNRTQWLCLDTELA